MIRPYRIPEPTVTAAEARGAWTIHHIATAPTIEAFKARVCQALRSGTNPALIAHAISSYTKEHPE